ncbi:MAG: CDP-alcohol phosphatidyltransferase family protein [bacterium]|nr:CDP-alcohol phosphatidyltransferase family protein [bacterium]
MDVPTPAGSSRSLVRSLVPADFLTLGNAICGTVSIFLCLNYLEGGRHRPDLFGAFVLLPLAAVLDAADGFVARRQRRASAYGADLDSLADVVSFGVAPAVLGFTVGLRGVWDSLILSLFVCCGVARLARYNVTAATLAAGTGKVRYYEGTPIPTSLVIVALLGVAWWSGATGDAVWFGRLQLGPAGFHPLVLVYLLSGMLMVSRVRIPKP